MQLVEYQAEAAETAQYPNIGSNIIYPALGLGEIGEIANQVKKVYRDDGGIFTEERIRELRKEAGDLLWYINAVANEMGVLVDAAFDERLTFARLHEVAEQVGTSYAIVRSGRADLQTLWMMKLVGQIADEAEFYDSKTGSNTYISNLLAELLRALDLFVSSHLGTSLEQVALANLEKLTDRARRNAIQGSGDNR